MNNHDKVFVDFNTIAFKDWSRVHYVHEKQYQETEDGDRRFRFVKCVDCGQLYYLGEYKEEQ